MLGVYDRCYLPGREGVISFTGLCLSLDDHGAELDMVQLRNGLKLIIHSQHLSPIWNIKGWTTLTETLGIDTTHKMTAFF